MLWAFIVPGLEKRERRYIYGFLGSAIPLFLLGCAAGWFYRSRAVPANPGHNDCAERREFPGRSELAFSYKLSASLLSCSEVLRGLWSGLLAFEQ